MFTLKYNGIAVGLAAMAVCMGGCGRKDDARVRYVNVPKTPVDASAMAATGPEMSNVPDGILPATAPSSALSYTAPAGWMKEGEKPMREVSFTIPAGDRKAEVIVTRLPQGSGDFVMNVNRWRHQVGLAEVESADANSGKPIAIGDGQGHLFDFVGPEGANPQLRQMVAIFNKSGNDWFFKIIGPADLVESQQASFATFLGSVRLGD